MYDIKKLWRHLSKRRHKQFWLVLVLMIISSFAEMVSIGLILPFLGALTAPEKIYNHEMMQYLIQYLNISTSDQIIFPLTAIFVSSAMFAGMIRLSLLYSMSRLSFSTGADLSIDIYRRTLYQDYSRHLNHNSSEIINGIINKTNTVVNKVLTPMLTLVSATILLIGITATLFAIDIVAASTALIGFGFMYWLVTMLTRKRISKNSLYIAEESTNMIKALQEGLGGIRDVIIDGAQEYYCDLYRKADLKMRKSAFENAFIGASPHVVMTTIGMSLIAILAYMMSLRADGVVGAIPVLGALALGAQRLLPAVQQIYHSLTSFRGAKHSLQDVLKLLSEPVMDYSNRNVKPIEFKERIKLNDLTFSYNKNGGTVLSNVNLTIKKGESIGFIGETGSGKSTLLDIIMGLLFVKEKSIFVDNIPLNHKNYRNWQAHIAHVPQNIYLSDGTIEENIAFGMPENKIDHKRVQKAAKQAQISGLIDGWQEGYQTFVGERGIRLSGGQKQRIGIARALYKQADVLIFDEATSALDNETEQAVMEAVESLGGELTILIIAHRLTTLKGCDQIIKLDKNNIVHTGSYEEMIQA